MPIPILIVDDEPVQRRLLEAAVQKFGYAPTVVENGAEAVRILLGPDGERFGLVVLDLMMPELDGLGVLARLRQAGRQLPHDGNADAQRAARGVAANEFDAKACGHGKKTARKGRDPGLVGSG